MVTHLTTIVSLYNHPEDDRITDRNIFYVLLNVHLVRSV